MRTQSFKITQNAAIFNSKKEVLILKHKTGKWLLPGGKINKRETYLEALKRELTEELSIYKLKIIKILDVDTWFESKTGYCVITYLIKLPDKPFIIKLSKEHLEYRWVNLKNLRKYKFWNPKIKQRIKKAF